ncbi:MAG TPA: alginate export family protein, partial [Tepidisphaeraceae bacterium]|nr:alginate export family protein [Tepidisphaeraceae bacterium]
DDDTNFAGIYDVISFPDFIREARTKVDVYGLWLGHDNTAPSSAPSNDSDTFTLGVHLFTNPKPWDLDVEADWQFGEVADDDIKAWSFAIEGGYSPTGVTWSPRLLLGFDIATGDDNPTDGERETFNQLFPSGHPYFGFIDVIGRQNIIDVHGGISFKFAPTVSLLLEHYFFWRESTHDALYTAAGTPLIPGGASNTNYIGSEFDVLLTVQFDRHWSGYAGYSHFFAGDFVEEAGAGSGADDDINFVYGALMFTF